jgi:DNA-binding CsgD family transcriptional regulator
MHRRDHSTMETGSLDRGDTDGLDTRAQHLMRALARELASPEAGQDVVLDVEVDGIRYTIIRHAPASRAAIPRLSGREQEIARMVAKGYTNKTIAAVLEISSWTVDTHIRRIFSKLGVRSRSAMVARLAAAGVIADDDGTPEWRVAWAGQLDARRA